jgi:hypothetical protein
MSRYLTLLGTLALGLASGRIQAAVVYQNNTTSTGVVNALLLPNQANSTEHGNTVTLVGTERIVTSVSVYLRVLGAGVASFNRELRLYRNDGPSGQPGTLLWASGPIFTIIDSGAPIPYPFTVPQIVVADSFTWTIQITNRQLNQAQLGPAEYNPPAVGSAPFGYWRRTGPGPDDWEFTGLGEAPFGAVVNAIPCTTPRNGDINSDCVTDGRDIAGFTDALLAASSTVPHVCAADFNGNGYIDLGDAPGMVDSLLTL